jgi:hypothetical protein
MSIGSFTDKQYRPTDKEVSKELGSSYPKWLAFSEYLRLLYKTKEDFRFLYGRTYGWGLRFQTKGKLLTALYPNRGFFIVQIILSHIQLSKTKGIGLHKNALAAIDAANPYPEGKWIFVPIKTDIDLKDAWHLLALKQE